MRSARHRRRRRLLAAVAVALGIAAAGCGGSSQTAGEGTAPAPTATGGAPGAPELRVRPLPERLSPLSGRFAKHVDVWGVDIVATEATEDAKVLHAARVMAGYLDNDADGTPDDRSVVDAMVANRATLLTAATPDELEGPQADAAIGFVGPGGQDLYGTETAPGAGFDAALEEVHHLILNTGWAEVFPDRLAASPGSATAEAMDRARGGRFASVPDRYPAGAWYTYDDRTCDYACQVSEYAYWAHTSLLGAQAGRGAEVDDEWRLPAPDAVRRGDPAATAVLEDPALGLPTQLPGGDYPD